MKIYIDEEFNDIGFLCRRWREGEKISVQRIADLCDCSRQNVTAFERGEVKSMRVFLSYVAAGFCLLGWKKGTLLAGSTKDILDCVNGLEYAQKTISRKIEEVIDNENRNN